MNIDNMSLFKQIRNRLFFPRIILRWFAKIKYGADKLPEKQSNVTERNEIQLQDRPGTNAARCLQKRRMMHTKAVRRR